MKLKVGERLCLVRFPKEFSSSNHREVYGDAIEDELLAVRVCNDLCNMSNHSKGARVTK